MCPQEATTWHGDIARTLHVLVKGPNRGPPPAAEPHRLQAPNDANRGRDDGQRSPRLRHWPGTCELLPGWGSRCMLHCKVIQGHSGVWAYLGEPGESRRPPAGVLSGSKRGTHAGGWPEHWRVPAAALWFSSSH